jgi:hypothetical protein
MWLSAIYWSIAIAFDYYEWQVDASVQILKIALLCAIMNLSEHIDFVNNNPPMSSPPSYCIAFRYVCDIIDVRESLRRALRKNAYSNIAWACVFLELINVIWRQSIPDEPALSRTILHTLINYEFYDLLWPWGGRGFAPSPPRPPPTPWYAEIDVTTLKRFGDLMIIMLITFVNPFAGLCLYFVKVQPPHL